MQWIKNMPPGRMWAYVGVILGLAASIAGNVANTVLFQHDSVPIELRIALAVFWPVALGVGIEILTRTEWVSNWRHWVARALLLGPMSLVAAIVSYGHLHHLMLMAGENGTAQALGPLAIDGTLFGSTVALLVTRQVRTLPALTDLEVPEVPAIRVPAEVPSMKAPEVPAPAKVPELAEVPTEDPRPVSPAPARVPALRGQWDAHKAVRLLLDPNGGTDAAIATEVGTGYKSIQRTRTAVKILRDNPRAEVPKTLKVPAAVVDIIKREVIR